MVSGNEDADVIQLSFYEEEEVKATKLTEEEIAKRRKNRKNG
ncbi:MAG: hypothetical protein ACLSGB_10550 [Dorea sp.]